MQLQAGVQNPRRHFGPVALPRSYAIPQVRKTQELVKDVGAQIEEEFQRVQKMRSIRRSGFVFLSKERDGDVSRGGRGEVPCEFFDGRLQQTLERTVLESCDADQRTQSASRQYWHSACRRLVPAHVFWDTLSSTAQSRILQNWTRSSRK